MIELKKDQLVFQFPEVHTEARFGLSLQRTLRIPDDGEDYPLPPGLGKFPMRHVDDFLDRVPESWRQRGGVMVPMYQSEALWLNFDGHYPFALKVATGKIDAITGERWSRGLHDDPQDYLSLPSQPWLDGYCVEKGTIRQFVAMPLGAGYTAEEQITGEAEHGGIQIVAYPMKRKVWERLQSPVRLRRAPHVLMDSLSLSSAAAPDMGLAPGGRMRQEIYDDKHGLDAWDREHSSRCFIHIANSLTWRAITGQHPPTTPPTAEDYTRRGMPWFDYYGGDERPVEGSGVLAKLKSVVEMGKAKGDVPLPENQSVYPENVVPLRKGLAKHLVRVGTF